MKNFTLAPAEAYHKCVDCGILSKTLVGGLCTRCRRISIIVDQAHDEGYDEGYDDAIQGKPRKTEEEK